ncbi:MAG: NAD-binding protein, partial [Actinobacteria bacterium]|nr:NAD-binding protein [Actinomycetota bacterium]
NCVVTSPAEIAVPSLVAACLGDGASATRPGLRPPLDLVGRQCRPYDATTRAVVGGVVSLLALVALDCGIGVTVLNLPPWQAFYAAARTVATVGPGEGGGRLPGWYLAYSALAVLATIVVTAVFTASVVNYLHSPRSVRLFGRLARPVRGHVVVVGLGQVGLRLCTELKAAGVPVVAVERDPTATNLRLARLAGVPVLIAHAEDRAVLSRVGLDRAVALAAMGSDELDNVEVAIAALGVCPDLRVVLRAGESDVIAETRSLFHIGEVSNVSAITADRVTQLVAADKRAITTAPLTPDVRCGCL